MVDSQAKIPNPYLIVFAPNEHILRLHISVDNLEFVQIVETSNNLFKNLVILLSTHGCVPALNKLE